MFIFQLDIEGLEKHLLRNWLENGQFEQIKQISLEFHSVPDFIHDYEEHGKIYNAHFPICKKKAEKNLKKKTITVCPC